MLAARATEPSAGCVGGSGGTGQGGAGLGCAHTRCLCPSRRGSRGHFALSSLSRRPFLPSLFPFPAFARPCVLCPGPAASRLPSSGHCRPPTCREEAPARLPRGASCGRAGRKAPRRRGAPPGWRPQQGGQRSGAAASTSAHTEPGASAGSAGAGDPPMHPRGWGATASSPRPIRRGCREPPSDLTKGKPQSPLCSE